MHAKVFFTEILPLKKPVKRVIKHVWSMERSLSKILRMKQHFSWASVIRRGSRLAIHSVTMIHGLDENAECRGE